MRLLLLALMLAGLALSTSIPEAFESRGLVFGIAYTVMQVGRTLFMLVVIPRSDEALRLNFLRILDLVLRGERALADGCVHAKGTARLGAWCSRARHRVHLGGGELLDPRGWAPPEASDWNIEGGHLAERCALFVIIALGESVLISGATFADEKPGTRPLWLRSRSASPAALRCGGSTSTRAPSSAAQRIRRAEDPGALGHLSYTYLHLPIIAGVILAAVSDELLLSHPDGHSRTPKIVVSVIGEPLVYLIGVILFKRSLRGWFQPSRRRHHRLCALIPIAERCSPLALGALATLVLLIVATWETFSLRRTPTADVGAGEEIED